MQISIYIRYSIGYCCLVELTMKYINTDKQNKTKQKKRKKSLNLNSYTIVQHFFFIFFINLSYVINNTVLQTVYLKEKKNGEYNIHMQL